MNVEYTCTSYVKKIPPHPQTQNQNKDFKFVCPMFSEFFYQQYFIDDLLYLHESFDFNEKMRLLNVIECLRIVINV